MNNTIQNNKDTKSYTTESLSSNEKRLKNTPLPSDKAIDESVTLPKIGIIGVGGAGGNAVHNMLINHLEGCKLIIANTDAQALHHNQADIKIQLGEQTTQGLGAGSRPDIGKIAAEESLESIKESLEGLHMLFLTAGMGGGTGTGASPIIAKAAKEKNILTIGFITTPFNFEGQKRKLIAEQGIAELLKVVDTLVVIPNQNLFRIADENTSFHDAFILADNVLYNGISSVVDLMLKPGMINLDFSDIRSVMQDTGRAMMGTGEAEGPNRAIEAAELSMQNPLLDDNNIETAKNILISITGSQDLKIYEVDEAANSIRDKVSANSNIIFGCFFDDQLGSKIRISIIAAGIEINDSQKLSDSKNSNVSVNKNNAQFVQKNSTSEEKTQNRNNNVSSNVFMSDATTMTSKWLDEQQLSENQDSNNNPTPSDPNTNQETHNTPPQKSLQEQILTQSSNDFTQDIQDKIISSYDSLKNHSESRTDALTESFTHSELENLKIQSSSFSASKQNTDKDMQDLFTSAADEPSFDGTSSDGTSPDKPSSDEPSSDGPSPDKKLLKKSKSQQDDKKDIFDFIKDFEDDIFDEKDNQLSIPAFLRKKDAK